MDLRGFQSIFFPPGHIFFRYFLEFSQASRWFCSSEEMENDAPGNRREDSVMQDVEADFLDRNVDLWGPGKRIQKTTENITWIQLWA